MSELSEIKCKLGVSNIQGIGVIALMDMEIGENPFPNLNIVNIGRFVNETEIPSGIPKKIIDYIKTIWCQGYLNKIWIPKYPNITNITNYLNHSYDPNTKYDESSGDYVIIKNVKEGDELTVSYMDLCKGKHVLLQ